MELEPEFKFSNQLDLESDSSSISIVEPDSSSISIVELDPDFWKAFSEQKTRTRAN